LLYNIKMKIKSLKENELLKDFIYSSEKTKDNFEKFYILTTNKDIKEEIPYIIKIKENKYNILDIIIEIPEINKLLAVNDKKENIIYTENNIFEILEYEKDLYKLNRSINDITKIIKEIDFSIVDKLLNILYEFKRIIYEYEVSINILNDEKLKEIIKDINQNIKNIEKTIIMKGEYLDMKTNRILTILSLITFPILLVSAWFGANFPKKQMKFMTWEYSYITVLIICIIFVIYCVYIFRNDIRTMMI
jgi:Mg2+ and Co2+ transporter CorA